MFDLTNNQMENNSEWSLPDVTIPAELPPVSTFGIVDDTVKYVAPVASGAVNQSSSWGDWLKPVVSTGQTLLNVWGQLQGLEAQKTQMETQRIGDMAVRSAQADSAAEIAKLQASSAVAVEKARSEGAVAKAQGEAQAAKTGAVYIPAAASLNLPVLLGIAALGLAFFTARNKAK